MPDDLPLLDPLEDCAWRTPRQIFARHGYAPLSPAELTDRQLSGRLWELLYAAAARRFYFHQTDHLSAREVYTLLWEQWLDEPTADIPLEAETNTHLHLSEFNANGLTHEEIWLRYYAREDDLELWRKDDPNFIFPPHENPPHDRDRFLPTPAGCPATPSQMKKMKTTTPTRSASPPLTTKSQQQKPHHIHPTPRSNPNSPPANQKTGRRPRSSSPRKTFHSCRPPRSPTKPSRRFSGNCCTTCRCKAFTCCTATT